MAITSFYLLNMFPLMRTLHHHRTINTQHPSQTCSPRCALHHHHRTINTQHPSQTCSLKCTLIHHHLTINTQHPDKTCSLGCALYIITEQSTPNTQTNMFPQMRTLHHHLTINTQHPDKTCSLGCALYIITEQSTPNTQTKHVPPDAHFTSSPNNQHPTPKPNMFPQMRTLHHHLTVNTQQP